MRRRVKNPSEDFYKEKMIIEKCSLESIVTLSKY